jgi:hypothetical protein
VRRGCVVLVASVAEVEESEMVSQEFGTSVAFVRGRPTGSKTSPSDGRPMMVIVLVKGWGAVGIDLMEVRSWLEPTRTSSND